MDLGYWYAGKIHVSTTDIEAVKGLYQIVDKDQKGYEYRELRKEAYKALLETHHANQDFMKEFKL